MHKLLRVFVSALLVGVIACAFAWRHLGAWLEAPGTPATTLSAADALLILGGESGSRTERGVALWKAGLAPAILLTGERDAPDGSAAVSSRTAAFVRAGVPPGAILTETNARNSWEEAVNARAIMRARGWHHIIVVSDPPHLRRLQWVWSRLLEGTGLTYTLVASEPRWWNARQWWSNAIGARFALYEALKIAYYVIAHGASGRSAATM